MPFTLDDKLVIAVATSALFDMAEANKVFNERGDVAYQRYMRELENVPLDSGSAFPFIRRLLRLNDPSAGWAPVEVVVLSRNSADTGLRAMNSLSHHEFSISRAAFTRGEPPFKYMAPFKAKLFLSTNEEDVRAAIAAGHAAGLIMPSEFEDDTKDEQLRVAFDFDGILADDAAEAVFQTEGLAGFYEHEHTHAAIPLKPGPLIPLLEEIARLQSEDLVRREKGEMPRIRTAVFTARNAPAHTRAILSLRAWGIDVDEAFFLGGLEKTAFLEQFKPHIFFDDQAGHITKASRAVPSVHIPFGVANMPKTTAAKE